MRRQNRGTQVGIGLVLLGLGAAAVAIAIPEQQNPSESASLPPMSAAITAAVDAEPPPPTTTTTAPPPPPTTAVPVTHSTTPKASRSTPVRSKTAPPPPPPASSGEVRTVNSTAYCLTSPTANGERGYPGSVAMNGVPFGSKWRIVGTDTVYRVNDRIGHGSQFDVWVSSCSYATDVYGRKTLTIERIS